jgi:hypothetical protein
MGKGEKGNENPIASKTQSHKDFLVQVSHILSVYPKSPLSLWERVRVREESG